MKIGDTVYAESPGDIYWVGVIIRTRDYHGQEQYRVFWNDTDETWEDSNTILTVSEYEAIMEKQ